MAKKQKISLFEKVTEDHQKVQEEFEKLPSEEQKKVKEGQRSLRKKWGNQPWY